MIQPKNSKPKMEFDSIDRFSGLPDCVIHSVLSLLPRKDAVRTSVLSKRWNRIWETYPYLVFLQSTYTKLPLAKPELTTESTLRIGDFLDVVKRSLSRSTLCGLIGHKFCLFMTIVDPKLSSKVDECFKLALASCPVEITFDNFMFELPEGGDAVLPEIVFVSDTFRCHSLQLLSLSWISLSDESVKNILLCCSKIRSIHLLMITGPAKLDIHDLDKLEEVEIITVERPNVDIADAPMLRRICVMVYAQYTPCTFNLTSCPGLRELNLGGICITDELFGSLFALCPLLEGVAFKMCKMPPNVTISSKCLTRLVLEDCNEIEAVEIDAPALASFKHQAEALPRLPFKTMPPQLEIVHTLTTRSLSTFRVPIHTSRFVDLRKFLAMSFLTDCLTVILGEPWLVVFDHQQLSQVVVPPAFQLQHLKLELQCEKPSFDVQALIDGLLWSCHPKTISVFSKNGRMPHSCIKVLSESLLEMEENLTCCGLAQVKCWRHGLKSAAAQSFEESGPNSPVIRFTLEWDNDSIW